MAEEDNQDSGLNGNRQKQEKYFSHLASAYAAPLKSKA